MKLAGKTLSLKDVKIPIYNLATKEDHIAPAKSVFVGSKFFGGKDQYEQALRELEAAIYAIAQ